MPVLTPEQEKIYRERSERIYPPDVLAKLNADNSTTTWWSGISDELDRRLTAIDRDRARPIPASSFRPRE